MKERIRVDDWSADDAWRGRCDPPAPGITPRLISGWPNRAVSAARMKSHIIASSHPPPSANPATAAMTGLRVRVNISHPAK